MGRRKKKVVAGAADTAACRVCNDAASGCNHREEPGAAAHAAVDECTWSQVAAHELGCGGEDVAACSMPAALAVKRRRSPDSRDMSPDSMHMPSPDASCAQLVQAEADLHCRQRYLMQHIMHIPPPKFVPKCDFTRILSDDAPRAAYRDLPHRMRTTNHWGQRKLFLSEVEFLSTFIHDLRLRAPPPRASWSCMPVLLQATTSPTSLIYSTTNPAICSLRSSTPHISTSPRAATNASPSTKSA